MSASADTRKTRSTKPSRILSGVRPDFSRAADTARRRSRQGKNLNDYGVSLLDPIKRLRLLDFTSSRSTAEAVEMRGANRPPEYSVRARFGMPRVWS